MEEHTEERERQFPNTKKTPNRLPVWPQPGTPIGSGVPGPGAHKRLVRNPPATPDEVRALLYQVLDADTANKMIYSLRKKIAKGNVTVLEFLFDRIIGRPAVNVYHQADGALGEFMRAFQQLAAEVAPSAGMIEGSARVIDIGEAEMLQYEGSESDTSDDDMETE